jgi:hypothetical protein
MPRILLTGAGFSHLWGGWLASEAFEYLLGVDNLHPIIRDRLWFHKERGTGFEGVYTELKARSHNDPRDVVFKQFHDMVSGMFHTMRHGFSRATIDGEVLRFLVQFNAIFTLNQDTLLEQKYLGFSQDDFRVSSNGNFFGTQLPGLERTVSMSAEAPGLYQPGPGPFTLAEKRQPYFKLHGSSNWTTGSDGNLMLILGGGKDIEIPKHPLLAWYHSEFARHLAGAQVLIIGYSFSDDHINAMLANAILKGARYFIVDPMCVDVIDKRNRNAQIPQPRAEMMEALIRGIDGASRRNLLNSLHRDRVEYSKLGHFLTADVRQRY